MFFDSICGEDLLKDELKQFPFGVLFIHSHLLNLLIHN